jgi:ABC-type nitrate/sulfonate/bicarbonate transport system permease component
MLNRTAWLGASALITVAIVLVWKQVTDSGAVPPLFLPGPVPTFHALIEGFRSGELTAVAAVTVGRMLAGWLSAALIGIVLGGAIASSRLVSDLLVPTLEFFRQIPSSAKLPIVILYMGLTSQMIIVVIALGAVWPVMLATIQGFQSVEPRLIETARILQMGKVEVFRKISLPSALPDIFAGLRISLTVALILAVVGEMLTGLTGLGEEIMRASSLFRSAELYAGILILGAVGFICNFALAVAGGRVVRR